MMSVVSQLIEEVTAHVQSDSFEDAPYICADGTYFPNNLRNNKIKSHLYSAQTHFVKGNIILYGYLFLCTVRNPLALNSKRIGIHYGKMWFCNLHDRRQPYLTVLGCPRRA